MIPRRLRAWVNWYLQERRQDRVAAGNDEPPVEPPLEPDPAAAAPAANADNAILLNSTASTSRFNFTTTITAGTDFTLGMWLRTVAQGIAFMAGPSTSIFTSNNHLAVFAAVEGITITGKDSAGVHLGNSSANPANGSSRGISSRFNVLPNTPVFCVLRRSGSVISMHLKFPGQAPRKVSEETTNFGGFSVAQGTYVGCDRSSSFRWHGQARKVFLVSYALTDAQIHDVSNGADPATFGTPAATDYHFPDCPNAASWASTINGITASRFLTSGYATVTGLGYVPLANGVYITPDQDGKVWQRGSNNRATIPLSGRYNGAAAPVQVLPIDWTTGNSVGNWQTVDAAPSGGAWSGSIVLPARNGWYKFQTRKLIDGTPSSEVMTSSTRVGVGEVVLLMGQSSMDNIGSGAANNGGVNSVTANGLWSESLRIGYLINGVGKEDVNITSATNVGGQIQLGTQYPHGRRTGEFVRIHSVGGTVEANGGWTITVNGPSTLLLNGSTFVNAYTSGGLLFFVAPKVRVANSTIHTTLSDGHAIIGNYISSQAQCPVMLINRAVGATAIEYFTGYTYAGIGTGGAVTVMHARHAEKIGGVVWLHGHANIGDANYFSDAGTVGSYTGWGKLGALLDFWRAEFPNNDFSFGVCAFPGAAGVISALSPENVHNYRLGMRDWVVRKQAAGDARCYFGGFYHDHQPMSENAVPMNSHRNPPDYRKIAARVGHAYANRIGAIANGAEGPTITSASRSGAVITLTVAHNGGSGLRVQKSGARATGFEVSADDFATTLPISAVTFPNATTIELTLASPPAGPVRVRYQFGAPGVFTPGTPFTPRITAVANNGAGLIRVTTGLAAANQRPTGHDVATGDWIRVKDVAGTVEANDIWRAIRIDAENLDLEGSTFVNAQVAGALFGTALPTVVRELGVPVYDNRTIGAYDTDGAPLSPTYQPLLTN